jgi:NADPH:quinone reductase-like Zn-dependent oxidoreductase/pimeloyl-ACP methyl ester carboxylesterase
MQDVIRKLYIDTDAGQIHGRRVEGVDDDTRLPVILLHRTPASSASFESMLRLLAGQRTAIALDTPGFGQSFRPAGMPGTVDYARWFLAAIDALGIDQFHLCPHHTGTHFAVEMALLAPERIRSLLLSGVLYADAPARAQMHAEIGTAGGIDPEGAYLGTTWTIMRSLFPVFDAELVHAETMGALASMPGRDQAFNAILSQDFKAVLAQVRCPVKIVQASDDPLIHMLEQVRADQPQIPIELLGPAFLAAPELQPEQYAAVLLAFMHEHEGRDSAKQIPSNVPSNASSNMRSNTASSNSFSEPATPQGTSMTDRRFQLVRNPKGFDLEQTQAVAPTPGPGEVLFRVRAVSLNRRDLGVRDLSYPVAPDANHFTPLSDAAGSIVAVGSGVTGFAVGDRVCSTFFPGWTDGRVTLPALFSALGVGGSGVFADHVVLPATGVAHIPSGWSFEEGASIACAGVTAWSALMKLGKVQRDDWVLVIGTGGVAMFALQIAVAAGAKVVILSSSDEKLERAKALGAAATVNYNTHPDWDVVVRERTGGGVQHAVELGGVGTLPKSIASMGLGGHVALIGALAGFGGDIPGIAMIMGALRVSAVMVGSHADHLALSTFMVQHGIKPIIDSVFAVADAEQAYARSAAGAFGKVVIKME